MINNKFIVYEDSRIKATSGEVIFNKIKELNIDYEQENFIVFYLNIQNRILSEEILFKGGYDSCLICPNTIFRKALLNNAHKIILAHNHPSDSLSPSNEDIDVFNKLKQAGDLIQIKVLDSVIFNKGGFYSCIEL